MKVNHFKKYRILIITWICCCILMISMSLLWTFHPKMIITRSLIRMFTVSKLSANEFFDDIITIPDNKMELQCNGDIHQNISGRNFEFSGQLSIPSFDPEELKKISGYAFYGFLKNNNNTLECELSNRVLSFALNQKQYYLDINAGLKDRYQKSALKDYLGFTEFPQKIDELISAVSEDTFTISIPKKRSTGWVVALPTIASLVLKTDVSGQKTSYEYKTDHQIVPAYQYTLALSARDIAYIMEAFSANEFWTMFIKNGFLNARGSIYVDGSNARPYAIDMVVEDILHGYWNVTIEFHDRSKPELSLAKQYDIFFNHVTWTKPQDYFCVSTGFEHDFKKQSIKQTTSVIGGAGNYRINTPVVFSGYYDKLQNESRRAFRYKEQDYSLSMSRNKQALSFIFEQNQEKLYYGTIKIENSISDPMHIPEDKKAVDLLMSSKIRFLLEAANIISFFEKFIK